MVGVNDLVTITYTFLTCLRMQLSALLLLPATHLLLSLFPQGSLLVIESIIVIVCVIIYENFLGVKKVRILVFN